MKVFSTFSGVGGLDRPFHNDSAFEVVGMSEIDKFASSVLAYHWPNIPNFGDISKGYASRLPDFDVLIGGFPCQDLSFQGTQKGFAGTKSSLFKYLVPIIQTKRPKFILLENVEALLSSKFEMEFRYVRESIEREGYQFSYAVFDSSNYGTAQSRRRVFILGVRNNAAELESDSLHELLRHYKVEGFERTKAKPDNIISWSKSTRDAHIDHRLREDGLVNTLTTGKGCNGFSTGNFKLENGTSDGRKSGGKLRILTANECEELMTWPQDWTRYGSVHGRIIEQSDSKRYKQIGNGVVSNCVEPIKELIKKF